MDPRATARPSYKEAGIQLAISSIDSNQIGEAGTSLAGGLRNLNIQSDIMLRSAKGAKTEFADKQGTGML
jgi:hypothetical protein